MNYKAERQPETWGWHLLGLINPCVVIAANMIGGYWVTSGVIYMLILGPIMDFILGREKTPKPPHENGRPFEALLYIHAILQTAAIVSLVYRATVDGPEWTTWIAALSTGLCSGASGIIVAHELGHKRPRSLGWWIGRFNLLGVLYLHFTTEHNFTHHKHVATNNDPASARADESLWQFIARTIPAQFQDAVAVQRRKSRSRFLNPIYGGLVAQGMLLATLYAAVGPWSAAAFLLQAFFAVFLLEYINYIRHYGLSRAPGERQTEFHSWQSEERWSRWTLLELTRHPAHHMKASEPFWKLQPYADAPTLPSGYYGCFWIAMVPPLWKRIMRHRIPNASLPR
ncbi:MAG: alkane 1-monooxygenase [Planctomycetota bacterium]|nr:alkane 1-monooxygenase [Planctomycetota bacterium]